MRALGWLLLATFTLWGCSKGGTSSDTGTTTAERPDAGPSAPVVRKDCRGAPERAVCTDEDPFTVDDRCTQGTCRGTALKLEIVEAFTEPSAVTRRMSFLAPTDRTVVRARLAGADGLVGNLRWAVTPKGDATGPAKVMTELGPALTFAGSSKIGQNGSRKPNPALEYEVLAFLELDGKRLEAKLPQTLFIRQEEGDVLRQEYLDYATHFQPTAAQIVPPSRPRFNTGNYTVIAEEKKNGLETLLAGMTSHLRTLTNNDVQRVPVGRTGLPANTVVVDPGPAIFNVGPLGDTDPQGDDRCAGPVVNGRCAGAILAGPNGKAETVANNRRTFVDLERFVSSAYRNPQRNRAAGSITRNSLHTRGLALDIDPRTLELPGKTAAHAMCLVEQAGELAAAPSGKSFTERGAATFLECDDPFADHVHVNL